jgi:hypothetical protein
MPINNQILRAGGPAKRTATIERYHCFGTPHHWLQVHYRGKVLNWSARRPDGSYEGQTYADARHDGDDVLAAMRAHAKRMGFTHVRITGDWQGRTKPNGGAL